MIDSITQIHTTKTLWSNYCYDYPSFTYISKWIVMKVGIFKDIFQTDIFFKESKAMLL